MKGKLFDKPKNMLVSECGEWLLDGNIAYHVDILPDEVTKAMGDETLLKAVLKLNGKTFVKVENGPDFKAVMAQYSVKDKEVGYFKTPWEYTTQTGEKTTAFLSEDGDLALLPSFCTQNLSEVYGTPGGNTCFLARGDKMMICGWNTKFLEHTLVRKVSPTDLDTDLDY